MEDSTTIKPIRLRVADLESLSVIVSAKAMEIKQQCAFRNEDDQHEAIKNVYTDLVQILLGYMDEQEVRGMLKAHTGGDDDGSSKVKKQKTLEKKQHE